MSLLHPFQEYRFRKAFRRWASGKSAAATRELQVLAASDSGAARFLPLALAEGGEPGKGLEQARDLPSFPPGFMGVLFLWAGKPEEALETLGNLPHPNPLEQAVLGQALLEGERLQEAAGTWAQGGPASWRVISPRAMAALLEIHHRKEPEELRKRLAADFRGEAPPPGPSPFSRLFLPLLDLLRSALPALKGDRFSLERIRIQSLASRREWPEAIQRARRLRREFKDREEAADLLVQVLFEAREDRALVELGGEGPGRAALAGVALAGLGRWEEAQTSFRKALEEDPEDLVSAYGLACALALQGRRDEAARAFLVVLAMEETAFVEVLDREVRRFLEKEKAS